MSVSRPCSEAFAWSRPFPWIDFVFGMEYLLIILKLLLTFQGYVFIL